MPTVVLVNSESLNRQIFVRSREIDVPRTAVAVRGSVEDDAAELEGAVEVVERREGERPSPIEATAATTTAAALELRGCHGHSQ